MFGALSPNCLAISSKTPTPDPPSLAPSIGSFIRIISLSANGLVSQCAYSIIRFLESRLYCPTILDSSRIFPSKALDFPFCTITFAPCLLSSSANHSPQLTCSTELGTLGPNATWRSTKMYAESPENSGTSKLSRPASTPTTRSLPSSSLSHPHMTPLKIKTPTTKFFNQFMTPATTVFSVFYRNPHIT